MSEKLSFKEAMLASILTLAAPALTTGCSDDTVYAYGDGEAGEGDPQIGEAAIGIVSDSPGVDPDICLKDLGTVMGDEICDCEPKEKIFPRECNWNVTTEAEECQDEKLVRYCEYKIPMYFTDPNQGLVSFGFQVIPSIDGQYLETIEGYKLTSSSFNGPVEEFLPYFEEVRRSTLFFLDTPKVQLPLPSPSPLVYELRVTVDDDGEISQELVPAA